MKVLKTAMVMAAAAVLLATLGAGTASAARFDNFVLLVDQSGEMNMTYNDKSMNFIARDVATRILNNIPTDTPIQGAIYVYGVMAAKDHDKIQRVQMFGPFNKDKFRREFENEAKPQTGNSSLSVALRETYDVLSGVPGRTAVIIISGGNITDKGEPSTEAIQMKRGLGDRVCIFTILVGKSKRGGKFLNELTEKGGCGFPYSADSLSSGKQVHWYVQQIFQGTAGDADADGVPDNQDQCPGTPKGAPVDSRGCWVVNNINFDSAKYDIKPIYYNQLNEIASIMNANANVKILIEGHTDSDGGDDYNQNLSNNRANAVMNYLVSADVDAFRLRAVGKGETSPVASNATSQGKALNRRIEFTVVTQ
ncbi:MAG TPA: OmpA family protein [bacterium]|nr:OmpA family protein [bacterium]